MISTITCLYSGLICRCALTTTGEHKSETQYIYVYIGYQVNWIPCQSAYSIRDGGGGSFHLPSGYVAAIRNTYRHWVPVRPGSTAWAGAREVVLKVVYVPTEMYIHVRKQKKVMHKSSLCRKIAFQNRNRTAIETGCHCVAEVVTELNSMGCLPLRIQPTPTTTKGKCYILAMYFMHVQKTNSA